MLGTVAERPIRHTLEFHQWATNCWQVEDNDFNLNILRYVSTATKEVVIDQLLVCGRKIEIEKQIRESTAKHNAFLKELGLSQLPASD